MNDFDFDVKEKKKIARSASKRVGRTRKVTLPSDSLSIAEIKKLEGEVKVYKIGQPITLEELRSYPREMQIKYLEWIRDNLGATTGMLSEMFGISANYSCTALRRMNLIGILPKGNSESNHKKFKKWLKSFNEPVKKEKTEEPKPQREVVEPMFFDVISSCDMTLKGSAVKVGQMIFKLFHDQNIVVTVKFGEEPVIEQRECLMDETEVFDNGCEV